MDARPIAERFFDLDIAHGGLECELEDALLAAMGVDMNTPLVASCPFNGWCFDWYDSSFELRGTKPEWAPTEEHLAAAWALGFLRCWVCYSDGMERYASRTQPLGVSVQRDVRGHGECLRIKQLEKQLADARSQGVR